VLKVEELNSVLHLIIETSRRSHKTAMFLRSKGSLYTKLVLELRYLIDNLYSFHV
jgi:hypothetical protein